METLEHTILVDGIELKISDLSSSETMVHMKEQVFGHDEYNIRNTKFENGDIVIDIGANVGCVSLWLAKKYPYIKIYSFEAHPVNYNNLLKNINANNVSNIIPHNLAVFSEDGIEKKITLNNRNTGSSSLFKTNTNSPHTHNVKTIKLDSIINKYQIPRIKFLKLDCEGAEFDILNNSELIHKIPIDVVAAEIHTFASNESNSVDKLISLIRKISINTPICKVYSLG